MSRLKKPKMFLIIFFILLFSFVSCNEDKTTSSTEDTNTYYILNTNSKKIHLSTCGTSKRINEDNKENYYGDLDNLFDVGYTECGNCFK